MKLTPQEAAQYETDGFLFPVPVLTPEETERYREAYFDLERRLGGKPKAVQLTHTHLCFDWSYELCKHPRVLDAVEGVLGPDILVWATSIFPKKARDPGYISFHQDATYWGLDSSQVTTAWIALTESTPENGCMRVVPGSHKEKVYPHRETWAAGNMLSRGQEVEVKVDESKAVDIVLRPGEMSLHHVNIIHGSNANPSDKPRIGFTVRFLTPKVNQTGDKIPAVLARGRDDYHHFELMEGPPRMKSLEEAVERQKALARKSLDSILKNQAVK